MARATLTSLFSKYGIQGLSQLALIGTVFAALRLFQSPSTLTFFVFESALAAYLGLLFSARVAPPRHPALSDVQRAPDSDIDESDSYSFGRLRSLAAELGITSIGDLNDLRDRIKSELAAPRANAAEVGIEEVLGRLIVDRIAPRARLSGSLREPSAASGSLSLLTEEGGNLLSLARDLRARSTFYRGALRKARKASAGGRVEASITHLENGNRRLRARLGALVARDLKKNRGTPRSYPILTSVFFSCTALALLILSTALYVAPLAFYFLVAVAAGTLSLNAHFNGNQRWRGVLLQIVIMATLVKLHFFFLNPYLYTSDSFLHFVLVQGIAGSGHVSDAPSHYSYFPGYHAFGFAGVSIVGLPLTWFGIFAFVSQIVTIPAVYLVGRETANHRVGLFAAIITLFSVFAFLPVIPLPSLFGLLFLFLAIYALIKSTKSGWGGWLALFWISALGALFAHPTTGLILVLALLIRFIHFHVIDRRGAARGPSAIPFLSYGMVYGGYLAFIAFVSFELFVRTMLAPTYSPPLATSPSVDLQTTDLYLFQSALAPLSFAVLLFFASYGMFSSSGISATERQYFVLLGLIFILIPAVEIAAENFRGQSSRLLNYLIVPLAVLGAHGVVSANRLIRTGRRVAGILLPLFVIFAFISSSSYLTSNDERFMYSAIPAIPTHITDSALSSREFLALSPGDRVAFMDLGSFLYFYNGDRARYPLSMGILKLEQFNGSAHGTYVVLNQDLLAYGSVDVGGFYDTAGVQATLADSQALLLYDAGSVRIYFLP